MHYFKSLILIFVSLTLIQGYTKAQYTILLLNGHEKQIINYELRGGDLVYKKPDDKKENIIKWIATEFFL